MPKKSKNYSQGHIKPSVLEEAAVAITNNYTKNFSVLMGTANKAENKMTSFEKMHVIREGVSKTDLEHLKVKTDLDYTMLAMVLGVTRATLINKKNSEKFSTGLSEKIVGLADLYSYGFEVFENEDSFNHWMGRPNKALGGEVPYNVIDNQFGREEVKSIIGRIAYGVYS